MNLSISKRTNAFRNELFSHQSTIHRKKIQNKKLFGLLNIFSALNNLTSALSSCYIKYFSKIVLCTIFRLWSIIKTMEQCRNQHEFIRNYIMLVWQLPECRLWQQSASLTFALNQRCGQQKCDWMTERECHPKTPQMKTFIVEWSVTE